MSFAFGSLGLGVLLFALVALFTREAHWVFVLNLALAAFSLWETFGRYRRNAALGVGSVLILSAIVVLVLREPPVLALANFLLGSGFFLASAKYHYHHPEEFGRNDFLGRQWARISRQQQAATAQRREGMFSEGDAPSHKHDVPHEQLRGQQPLPR